MNYKIIYSKRKTLSLEINDRLEPLVRAPYNLEEQKIEKFVLDHTEWIKNTTEHKKLLINKYNLTETKKAELKIKALNYIPQRVEYYSKLMGLRHNGIKITSAKKRFGSCSYKNSLCFSLYLMLYSNKAIDYVVVHELAHIVYKNHSDKFYALIEKYMPDYKLRQKLLNKGG